MKQRKKGTPPISRKTLCETCREMKEDVKHRALCAGFRCNACYARVLKRLEDKRREKGGK